MAKIFTLYNHKGGVSKTTTTFNLANALAQRFNKRVLIVDADPQCNLTELSLGYYIDALDQETARTGTENQLPGTTILDALKPRFGGDRSSVDVDSIELLQANRFDARVIILRGDIALSEAEDTLSQAHSMRTSNDIHQKRNYVAIHDMLRRLSDRYDADYVLVDVGPSAGALTRACFLAADGFLVPVFPDRFNYQAMSSLSHIITKWVQEHSTIVDDFRRLGLNVGDGKPVFYGLIVQRFQRYGGSPKPAFEHWMRRLPQRALMQLMPAYEHVAGKDALVDRCRKNPSIVEIPDFSSLAPMMLTHGKPVWDLTQTDTDWRGNVWEERAATMAQLKAKFFELAEYVGQ